MTHDDDNANARREALIEQMTSFEDIGDAPDQIVIATCEEICAIGVQRDSTHVTISILLLMRLVAICKDKQLVALRSNVDN